jgi:glycosyltransferase involved in cell wall biosynthesis
MRGEPYVVSVDATPVQFDSVGRWYGHERGSRVGERAKRQWYGSVLRRAKTVISWSDWAAKSLVSDYRVSPERIAVIHPGAPPDLFEIPRGIANRGRPRVLFVGGDLERKGGHHLLDAANRMATSVELVLMTEADLPEQPGVTVLRGVRPGTSEFLRAFTDVDIFCLPSLGDCTPVAIGEAMAAGLPVVTTDVGSNRETVPADAGIIVPPGNVNELAAALDTLAGDHLAQRRMGFTAREIARDRFDAHRNATQVINVLMAAGR